MQCHIEMTAELIETWCADGRQEIEEALHAARRCRQPEEMRDELAARVERLHQVADACLRPLDRGSRTR